MCNGEKLMSELTVPVTPVYVLTGGELAENGVYVLDASTRIDDLMDRFHAETQNGVYGTLSIMKFPDESEDSVLSWVDGYPLIYDEEVLCG